MSLQERTLVVKNFDPDQTTPKLLEELCLQAGPVRNVVMKPDHAFVEYEDIESVGYSKALLDGVILFGKKLIMEPKTKTPPYFKDTQLLRDYINYDKQNQARQRQEQTMLMIANQQTQTPYEFAYPQTNVPIFNGANPDPNIFTYTQQQQAVNSQQMFPVYNGERPSTSNYPSRNINSNRRRPRHSRR